jgi:peroxiredoxin
MKWRSLEESSSEPDSRSLRDQLAERKELSAKYVPPEVLAIHARVVDELKQSGIAERALQAGSTAPQFELPDQHGRPMSSADAFTKGPLVVCFIRGRWDPFCCGQMEAMNAALPKIGDAGASLVAISPQTVSQSFFMADQHKLRFPLLSDAGNTVARQFGLVYRVPDDQQAIYRRAFINLPFANGDESWELPTPATYVVKKNGTVAESWIDPDYTERPEPADIIEKLRGLTER